MYIVEEMACFDVGFSRDGSVVVGCMADSSVRLLDWRQVSPPQHSRGGGQGSVIHPTTTDLLRQYLYFCTRYFCTSILL